MNPSMREYLHTLETSREAVINVKSEQNKIKFLISSLYEENKRLTNELRENVEMRFLHSSDSYMGQLEQQLQDADASKRAAIELWQAALQQLEKMEELLVGKKSIVATERSELEKQFAQMKEEYAKGLNVLSEELSQSRSELSRLKKELEVKNSELERSIADVESANKHLELSKKTISELTDVNSQLTEENHSLQSILTESDKIVNATKEEITAQKTKITELSGYALKLEEQTKKLKSEKLIYEKDAKESLLAAEQAILQKQEILCKEEQYQKEIKMLKSSIDVEKEKVSLRFKAEIKDIKKKSDEKIQALISEIDHLHKEIGEKQNLFERADREKQALESKLEKLISVNSSGVPVSNSVFEDMCKRLTIAERSRDELELKVLSLETALQEIKSAKEQEIQYLSEKYSSLHERLKNLSKDFNQAASDRVKFSDEVTKLKKKLADQEKELTQCKTKYSSTVSTLETESRRKQQALQEQLRFTKEHYKNVCSELQKLLEAEFAISNKWKAEVEDLISKSEATVKELLQDNAQLKNSNSELINILHQNNLRIPNDVLFSLS